MKDIKKLLEFGVINIDKPRGPTSFAVSQFVKNKLGLKKAAHMGTLDPQVSGVLPVTLNRACKLSNWFMGQDKEYVGVMRLHSDISDVELKRKMKEFVGKITQLPPVRSAVKREEREREVKKFEILEKKDKDVLFLAAVEAGTYIRKLCSDLGEGIGGAHMLELRRISAGIFSEEKIVDLYEFERIVDSGNLDEIIVPAEKVILKYLPKVEISEESLDQLLVGKPLMEKDVVGKLVGRGVFAVFLEKRFVGVYERVDEGDIVGRAEFVFN